MLTYCDESVQKLEAKTLIYFLTNLLLHNIECLQDHDHKMEVQSLLLDKENLMKELAALKSQISIAAAHNERLIYDNFNLEQTSSTEGMRHFLKYSHNMFCCNIHFRQPSGRWGEDNRKSRPNKQIIIFLNHG